MHQTTVKHKQTRGLHGALSSPQKKCTVCTSINKRMRWALFGLVVPSPQSSLWTGFWFFHPNSLMTTWTPDKQRIERLWYFGCQKLAGFCTSVQNLALFQCEDKITHQPVWNKTGNHNRKGVCKNLTHK